jgi:hypothetical protein
LIRGTLCHSFHVSPVAAAVFIAKSELQRKDMEL